MSARPLIFSLLDTPAFGGAEQYMASNLKYFAEQGFSVVLATNNPKVATEIQKRVKHLPKKSFRIITAPYLLDAIGNWKGLIKFFIAAPTACVWLWRTLSQLKQKNDVVCVLPGFSDRLLFSPFMKLLKLPVIWIEIGPLEPTFAKNWGFPRLLYRLTQHFPDHFITTSLYTLQSMIRAGQIDKKKITLVYPGTPLFSSSQKAKFAQLGQKWRTQRHLQKETLVAWIGRLAQENQLELLLNAFKEISEKRRDIKLVVIGDGPEKEHYQIMAYELDILPHVIFTGFVTEQEKYSILATSDVFVFTRSWELDGFGMTTIEAMSLGLPVITPQFGPQQEIIEEGKSGIHFEPNIATNLAEKLKYLIEHPQKRKMLSKNAEERVELFSEKRMHRNMLRTLEMV